MKTYDVYWYTKESRIIRVEAKSEKAALKMVREEGEDAGNVLDHSAEEDNPGVMEIKD